MNDPASPQTEKKYNPNSLGTRMAVGAGIGAILGLLGGKLIIGAAVGGCIGALLHLWRTRNTH